jgi:pyridoxine/pyridoxamine 5'-phosphate oxidase
MTSDTTTIKHPTPLTSGDFTAAAEPFALFAEWFAEAVTSEPNDPNAMALATVDSDGLPDVRMLLMKGYDAEGFVFYSHIASQKGRELAANPKAALLFHWKSLRRQVRIRGNVTRSHWSPPGTSSARCRGRRAGAAGASRRSASNSGTIVRSACTTASNSAAMCPRPRGPRLDCIHNRSSWPGVSGARLRVGCPGHRRLSSSDETRRRCRARGRA